MIELPRLKAIESLRRWFEIYSQRLSAADLLECYERGKAEYPAKTRQQTRIINNSWAVGEATDE